MRCWTLIYIAAGIVAAITPLGTRGADDVRDAIPADTTEAIEYLRGIDLEGRGDPDLFVQLGALYRGRDTITDRLRSQQVLERGLRRFPNNPRLLLELGRTYYAQTFYPDALRCFNSALDADSSFCDARYHLGMTYYDRWRRVNDHIDDISAARWHLKSALACDPGNRDAAFRYAAALYVLGEDTLALARCTDMIERFPDDADAYLLRGVVHFKDDRFKDAQADFTRGLDRLDAETREAYGEMEFVLSYRDHDKFNATPPSRRDALERGYWLEFDPDPTTRLNERWIEHVARVFLSDLYYSCVRPPLRGWETDRGKTFIKFGHPLSITTTLEGKPDNGYTEIWTYVIDGNFMAFPFVDEFLNGNRRIPRSSDQLWSFIGHTSFATSLPLPFDMARGTLDAVGFRDDEFSGTLVLAVAVAADSMAGSGRFALRGALFDNDWVSEQRFEDPLQTLTVAERDGAPLIELVRELPLSFDRYHVAVTLADEAGATASVMRVDTDARRYARDGVMISDVLLRRPADTPGASFVRRGQTLYPNTGGYYAAGEPVRIYFEIYNLDVLAGNSDYQMTFSIYESEVPVAAWRRWAGRLVELAGAGDDRLPAISQTFDRSGIAHVEAEELVINIESLAAGDYKLVIDVLDNISGRAGRAAALFVVGERQGATD